MRNVDFAAVGRIARRVGLRTIRLVEMDAKMLSEEDDLTALTANTEVGSVFEVGEKGLQVDCRYVFNVVTADDKPVARVKALYRMLYEVKGPEKAADADLGQFAFANGTYHSWPFLRQLVFDFTAKFGLAPYTLPVFLLDPSAKAPAAPPPQPQVAPPAPEAEPPAGDS